MPTDDSDALPPSLSSMWRGKPVEIPDPSEYLQPIPRLDLDTSSDWADLLEESGRQMREQRERTDAERAHELALAEQQLRIAEDSRQIAADSRDAAKSSLSIAKWALVVAVVAVLVAVAAISVTIALN